MKIPFTLDDLEFLKMRKLRGKLKGKKPISYLFDLNKLRGDLKWDVVVEKVRVNASFRKKKNTV